MSKPSFVYVIYIRSTPEKVWAALADPECNRLYWFGAEMQSEWKAGAAWRIAYPDGRIMDKGEIVECDPPKRLVIGNWQNQFRPELMAEGTSRCTIEIEPVEAGTVKLTVTHVSDGDGGKLIEAVSGGWPKILSNLKSLLETGQVTMETKS